MYDLPAIVRHLRFRRTDSTVEPLDLQLGWLSHVYARSRR